jgi:hypothetical protein
MRHVIDEVKKPRLVITPEKIADKDSESVVAKNGDGASVPK